MLKFARNTSFLELWQRSPLTLSTMTPFCTFCACALFTTPHLAHPVQIVPCPIIYCCSMHLTRHAQASSWHAVEHVSSWLLLCYKHQLVSNYSAICMRLAQCCASGISIAQCYALDIKIAQCCASDIIWLDIVASCTNNNYGSMLYIRQQYSSMLYIMH